MSEDGGSVVCVREDHGIDGKAKPVDVVNEVVAINLATGTEKGLATGRDFYAAPKLSPDGSQGRVRRVGPPEHAVGRDGTDSA